MKDWESTPTDYENFRKWTISRYWDTRNRYMVTARHKLGFQFKEYCTKGQWSGAPEHVNRVYEELQCELVMSKTSDIKITRNFLFDKVHMFEINQWQFGEFCETTYQEKGFWRPLKSMLIVKDKIFQSTAKQIKDGYRYNYEKLV